MAFLREMRVILRDAASVLEITAGPAQTDQRAARKKESVSV
jgi:hypothetical protein